MAGGWGAVKSLIIRSYYQDEQTSTETEGGLEQQLFERELGVSTRWPHFSFWNFSFRLFIWSFVSVDYGQETDGPLQLKTEEV